MGFPLPPGEGQGEGRPQGGMADRRSRKRFREMKAGPPSYAPQMSIPEDFTCKAGGVQYASTALRAALTPALSQGERGFRGSGLGPGGPCRQVIATGLPMEPVPPLIGSGANT